MGESEPVTGTSATPAADASADLHGRRRLPRNILTNWGSQVVQIAAGFIVPRLIDRQLGQAALGVWDLAWSVVVYFGLVQVGVTTSINRYVAFHRAQEDYAGINRVVSSVAMVMRLMALGALGLTLAATWAVGPLFAARLGPHLAEARWLVLLLGTGVAVQISSTVFGSILTGFHRWDWYNGIQAATNAVTLVGMVTVLYLDMGLIGLAAVSVLSEAAGRTARIMASYRLCPWLEVRWRHFRRETAREMLSFGGKSFLTQISNLLMNASVSLLVASHLGPAFLALYARPVALVRNLNAFVHKYAMVFSPTISSFQGAGRHEDVRDLALKATRYGLYLSLPILLLLGVFGDAVLQVWMGARYADRWLVVLIVCGFANQIAYVPLFGAMVGLNAHGRLGVANLLGAVTALAGSYLALAVLHTGVRGVALAVAVPMSIVNGVLFPLQACRVTKTPIGVFFREVWWHPRLVRSPLRRLSRCGAPPLRRSAGQGNGLGRRPRPGDLGGDVLAPGHSRPVEATDPRVASARAALAEGRPAPSLGWTAPVQPGISLRTKRNLPELLGAISFSSVTSTFIPRRTSLSPATASPRDARSATGSAPGSGTTASVTCPGCDWRHWNWRMPLAACMSRVSRVTPVRINPLMRVPSSATRKSLLRPMTEASRRLVRPHAQGPVAQTPRSSMR